jgi:hypothetical protein
VQHQEQAGATERTERRATDEDEEQSKKNKAKSENIFLYSSFIIA